MGIEAIGSGLGSVSAGSSVGAAVRVGPSIGPSIGSIAGRGFEGAKGFTPTIVNEGPVAPKFLENTMPLSFNEPLGEIIFNPFKSKEASLESEVTTPSVIQQAEEVAATAWKVSEPVSVVAQAEGIAVRAWETTEPKVKMLKQVFDREIQTESVQYDLVPVSEPTIARFSEPAPLPGVKVRTQPASAVSVGTENKVVTRVIRTTSTPTQREVYSQQIMEEKKVVKENKKEDKPQAKKSEKESVVKVKFVEDTQVSEQRRGAIRTAIKKAKAWAQTLGLRGITGRLVARHLPKEYWESEEYRSEIVKGKGVDETVKLTAKSIEIDANEYQSDEQAEGLVEKVKNYRPVKKGEGQPVTVEEVRQVLEGKEVESLKTQTPAEIVVRRLVRKSEIVKGEQAVTVATEEKVESSETSLKDFPALAEVFHPKSH